MTSLITESVNEKPLVLIIGDETDLSVLFTSLFIENDVSVFQIKKSDFISNVFMELIKSKSSLYKIYWFVGFGKGLIDDKDDEILKSLKTLTNYHKNIHFQNSPISIVFQYDSIIKTKNEIYENYFKQSQKKIKLLTRILEEIPNSQLMVAHDLVGECDAPLYPLLYLVGDIKNKKLIDANQTFCFQTSKDFFSAIASILLKPHNSNKFVVFGKKIHSGEVVEKISHLYNSYFGQNPDLVKLDVSDSNNDGFGFKKHGFIEVKSSSDEFFSFIDCFVRKIPVLGVGVRLLEANLSQELINSSNSSSLAPIKKPFPLPHRDLQPTSNINPKTSIGEMGGDLTLPETEEEDFTSFALKSSNDSNQAIGVVENFKTNHYITKKINKRAIHQSKNMSDEGGGEYEYKNNLKKKVIDDGVGLESDLENDILKLFGDSRESLKETRIDGKTKKKKNIVKKTKRKKTMFYVGVVVIGLGVLFSFLFALFQISSHLFKRDLIGYLNNNISEEIVGGDRSNTILFNSFWQKIVERKGKLYSLVFSEDILGDYQTYISIVSKINQIQKLTQQGQHDQIQAYSDVVNGSGISDNQISLMSGNSQLLFENLSQIAGDLRKTSGLKLSEDEKNTINLYMQKIDQKRQLFSYHNQYRAFLTRFLGVGEKRVYAVVLQNNLELRPTGGFIQAVAILTFDRGMLVDSKILNVYEIDDKIMSSVIPPDEMRKVLGEEKWYLRDGNWDPDFVNTSKNIAWFVEEGVGVKLDGVVAMNFNVIKDVLVELGDLNIAQHNEIITSKNIFERIEYHSKDDAQGKDYQTLLFEEFLNRLKTLSNDQVVSVLGVISNSLFEKETLISFIDEEEGEVLNELGWDGRLIQPNCPSQLASSDCFVDYIYQVEANSGINKVNAYIQRNIEHTINIEDEIIRHNRKIVYKNNSRTDVWPQGTYRTYIRFYTHDGSQLEKVMLNNKEVSLDLITKYKSQNKNVYAVLLEVPKNQETTLQITYSLKNQAMGVGNEEGVKPGDRGGFSYVFFDQKQPGWINDVLSLSMLNNSTYLPKTIAPQAVVEGSQIIFEVNRKEHSFVGVELK